MKMVAVDMKMLMECIDKKSKELWKYGNVARTKQNSV